MKRLYLPFLYVLLVGCASTRAVSPDHYTVLDASEADKAVSQCSRYSPTIDGSWMPSSAEISKLEMRIRQVERLKPLKERSEFGRVENVDDYNRQYVGVIVEGRRLIYVNAFPTTTFEDWPEDAGKRPDWRSKATIICDGGTAFWGVLYDPALDRFEALAFNGF